MPTNPLDLTDLIKISILIVKGSQPTGSVARTLLVSTFDASPAFPGRQKRYSGSATDIDAALAADPAFAEVCDARRDAWVAAMEADEIAAPLPWELAWCGNRDGDDAMRA